MLHGYGSKKNVMTDYMAVQYCMLTLSWHILVVRCMSKRILMIYILNYTVFSAIRKHRTSQTKFFQCEIPWAICFITKTKYGTYELQNLAFTVVHASYLFYLKREKPITNILILHNNYLEQHSRQCIIHKRFIDS